MINGTVITPEPGYKYLTNGKIWTTIVFLGKNDTTDNWRSTNDEPPEPEEDEDLSAEEALDIITGGHENEED